jgi:uncharacterized phiE125 gp8 family phage protein
MSIAQETAPPPISSAALAELKAHLGLSLSQDDAVLSGYLRAALSLCEAFTGKALLQRAVTHKLVMHHAAQSLPYMPVIAITSVSKTTANGMKTALPVASYSIDIDDRQKACVTLLGPLPILDGGEHVVAQYSVGLASQWTYLPDALRQGIIMLAAHFYNQPRNAQTHPPAAVTALWRPWRHLRVA